MTSPLLTVEEAASFVDLTVDELMLTRARALPPGILGFKEHPGGPLVWLRQDLLPPPRAIARAEDDLTCEVCGFESKSPGGLATHRRRHG